MYQSDKFHELRANPQRTSKIIEELTD